MPFQGDKRAVSVTRVDPEHVAVTVKNRTGTRTGYHLPSGEVIVADGNAEGVHIVAWAADAGVFTVKLDDGSIVPHESSDPEVVSDGQAQQVPGSQPIT